MNKFLLGGASALALLALGSTASAQEVTTPLGVGVDISTLLGQLETNVGGAYINAAVNNSLVDGSVDISTEGLLPGLNISEASLSVEASGAAAVALNAGELGLLPPTLTLPNASVSGAAAAELALGIIGTSIETGTLATTAIGTVNTGTIALAAVTSSTVDSTEIGVNVRPDLTFDSSVAESAANTSNTAASAAAAATSLDIDGGFEFSFADLSESTSSAPAAIVAANLAVQNALVDGSVTVSGATRAVVGATDTTAIGAVNTGTISNGLPGSITITVD